MSPGAAERLSGESPATLRGLTQAQAAQRLASEGFNEIEPPRPRTAWRIALEVAREPMLQLLMAAGAIYVVLGDRAEALMLLGFVAITASITVMQERRAERVLEALRDLASPRALVIRDGERVRIAGREVVRGDLLVLVEGDRVAADALLLGASDLRADESLLTGESVPVDKRAAMPQDPPPGDGVDQRPRPGGDGLPHVFSGTLIVGGQGVAQVTAAGVHSEIGRVGASLAAIAPEATPLQRQVRRLVRALALGGVTLSLVVVVLYGIGRQDWLGGLLAGITLAMAVLPEELPLILTVFMAMGSWRLSRQRVLTRRAAAIETLGSATVLCTDKTGTLTLNRMSVSQLRAFDTGSTDGHVVWTPEQQDLPPALHPLLQAGILASEPEPVDPMERAFVELGARQLPAALARRDLGELKHEYSLSAELLAMSHVWCWSGESSFTVATKGAPEAIAQLCRLDPASHTRMSAAVEAMARQGMRVLGVAQASFTGEIWPATQRDFSFHFLGLVGLADPLRESVPDAVRLCREAGIRVAMITGDYPATALAIAREAGIASDGGVISGDELRRMDEATLRKRLEQVSVFARIMPDQKLQIVNALRSDGQIVAMTGDGVNDAPSLKAAHIGIAMGGRGTDVAREASSIVLLDDDFGSIVQAVRLGRRIDDNLRKAVCFTLAVHVPIAGLSLLPLLFGWPLLFTPIHVAFMELVIDPVASLVFEAEPEEPDLMQRPPRDAAAPLLESRLMLWGLAQGLVVLAGVAAVFLGLLGSGMAEASARAAAFATLVMGSFALVIANRSLRGSLLAALIRPNAALVRIAVVTALLLGLAMSWAPAGALFRFGPLDASSLGKAILMGLEIFAVLSVLQSLRRGGAT